MIEDIFLTAQVVVEETIVNPVTGRPATVETVIKERSLFKPIRMKIHAKVLYGGQSRKAPCDFDGGDDTLRQCLSFKRIGGKQMVALDHDFASLEMFASKLQQQHQAHICITTTNPAGHFTCYTRQVDIQVHWAPNIRAIAADLNGRAIMG